MIEEKLRKLVVNFQTALVAKERGFDDPCLFYYRVHNGRLLKRKTEHLRGFETEVEPFMGGAYHSIASYYQGKKRVTAPFKQQLMDWLIDTHNIHININTVSGSPNKIYFEAQVVYLDGDAYTETDWYGDMGEITTLEDAYEVGFMEAFKIIEVMSTASK